MKNNANITTHDNSIEIMELVNGYLFRRVYIGYSKMEAIRLFKNAVKEERARL